jgi:hypothetical protein
MAAGAATDSATAAGPTHSRHLNWPRLEKISSRPSCRVSVLHVGRNRLPGINIWHVGDVRAATAGGDGWQRQRLDAQKLQRQLHCSSSWLQAAPGDLQAQNVLDLQKKCQL